MKWLKREREKLACYPFANPAGLICPAPNARPAAGCRPQTRICGCSRPTPALNLPAVPTRASRSGRYRRRNGSDPTATFIFSWDNLTSQGPRWLLPQRVLLVWNVSILRKQLLEIYPTIRPENVFVTGTPQFDTHFRRCYHWTREEFCARVGARIRAADRVHSTGRWPTTSRASLRIVEGIAAMLREMPLPVRPQLLVRVSPGI